MAYGYSLPLPSASELNQQAHPGGGTRVTDASREGLVEDLFEAHLRHLDVATKSAVCDRLCRVSNVLDGRGLSRQADLLDGIMMSFAAGAPEQWMSDDTTQSPNQRGATQQSAAVVKELMLTIKSLIDQVDFNSIKRFVHQRHYRTLKDEVYRLNDLMTSGDVAAASIQANVLEEKLLSYSINDLEMAFGADDGLLSFMSRDKNPEVRKFMMATSMLKKELGRMAYYGSSASGQDTGRSKVQDERITALTKRIADMIGRYASADDQTDDWKDLVTKEEYSGLYKDCLQKNPKLGYLNLLTKYQGRLDRVRVSDLPGWTDTLDGLEVILRNYEDYVRDVNQRILPRKSTTAPPTSDKATEHSAGQQSVDQGATPSFDYAPPMVGGG